MSFLLYLIFLTIDVFTIIDGITVLDAITVIDVITVVDGITVLDGSYSNYSKINTSLSNKLKMNEKLDVISNITDEATTAINLDTVALPVNFSILLKWNHICPSLSEIKNQGRCRSGWSIAIAGVITDRRCIDLESESELPLSPMMLLTCCPNCCGCGGGDILNAWKFVRDVGLLSGTMNSDNRLQANDGCQPYLLKPLSKTDIHKSSTQCLQTPPCIKTKCTNPQYSPSIGVRPSSFKISSFKLFSRNQPQEIMRELIKNGPLQVSFHLYEDFKEYTMIDGNCPIYIHTWGRREGDHAAKLIGWGTENEVKYWLLINSFGIHWGCNGTFKVPRDGNDNMEFGFIIVAPDVIKSSSLPVIIINYFRWTFIINFLYYTSN